MVMDNLLVTSGVLSKAKGTVWSYVLDLNNYMFWILMPWDSAIPGYEEC